MDTRWIYEKLDLLKSKPLREKDKRGIEDDKNKERWDERSAYGSFWKQRVASLGVNQLVSEIRKDTLTKSLAALKNNRIKWSELDPMERAAAITRLAMNMAEGITDDIGQVQEGEKDSAGDKDDRDRHRRRKKIQKRKHEKPPTGVRPRPNERKPDNPPNDDPKKPRLKSPRPPFQASPQPLPKKPEKPRFESRVGYFVSVSQLGFYETEPAVYFDPTVEVRFDSQPDGYLALRPGETWNSGWYEGPVIRGINIDMTGTHRLKYSKNGDFEE